MSKDANWILSSHPASATAGGGARLAPSKNPVERAEKLLSVLKNRLFCAQLNSFKNAIRTGSHPQQQQQKRNADIRRSLALQV